MRTIKLRITIKEKPVDYGKKLILGQEQPKCRVWNIRFSTKYKKGGLIKGKGNVKVLASGDSMLPKDAVEKYKQYLIYMLNENDKCEK